MNKLKVNFRKQCQAMSLMLYIDQIGYRNCDTDLETSKQILHSFLEKLAKQQELLFAGIVHYKEGVDGIEQNEDGKPHIHLLIYHRDRLTHCTTTINFLKNYGLEFIPDDETYLTKEGFKALQTSRHEIAKTLLYLTHETDKSILEQKPTYSKEEIVTNFPKSLIDCLEDEYEKYCRFTYINKEGKVKEFEEEQKLYEFVEQAFEKGKNFESFEQYLFSLPLRYRVKYENTLRHQYSLGVQQSMKTGNIRKPRCSIYLYGPPGVGKSTCTELALQNLGYQFITISGSSQTGGEDSVSVGDCIIYDDRFPYYLLDKADDRICGTYRRNSDNGIFTGDYFIMTNNLPFEKAYRKQHKIADDEPLDEQYEAIKSRFFIIRLENFIENYVQKENPDLKYLSNFQPIFYVEQYNKRGQYVKDGMYERRNELFNKFKHSFDNELSKYDAQVKNRAALNSFDDYSDF